jgi:hypothetical protein
VNLLEKYNIFKGLCVNILTNMFRSLNRKTFSLYDVTLTKSLLNIQEYVPLLEKKGIFDSILSN